jgi:hypothetical protein
VNDDEQNVGMEERMPTFDDPPRSSLTAGRAWFGAASADRQPDARTAHSIERRPPNGSQDATLVVNPTGDLVFRDHARRLAASSRDPLVLQARLRQHYPLAIVRRRELSGEAVEVWYVYRDGRWSPAEP